MSFRASQVVAGLPLPVLALLLAVSYLIPLFWFPLAPHVARLPLLDVRSFSPSLAGGLAYLLLLGFWFSLTWLAYLSVRNSLLPPSTRCLLLVAALFGLILLATYPINANDLFRYFIRARVAVVYGQSPLAVPITAFPGDPFIPLAGQWAGTTSPYGPVWELIAIAITALAPNNILVGLLGFKLLALVAHLASGWLIWQLLAGLSAGDRAARTLLWAWNPALLLMFVVDGHNDVVMLFWLLFGFWLMWRGQAALGMVVMTLGALTKLIALLPLPLFFLWAWRREGDSRRISKRQLRFALLAATGIVAVAILTFLPFGAPLALAGRLADEASGGGAFSPLVLLILLAREAGVTLSVTTVMRVALSLFALLALWLAWRVWRGRSPTRSTATIFAAYLLTALNFRIWYSTWLFPWLLLDEKGYARLLGGFTFLATAQASVVIYGHLRVFALGGDHVLAHLIGVPFTFGLPLLVTWLAVRR